MEFLTQIELVQLLGVNTIDQAFTFSMNKTITTMVGEKSVYQYVEEKHQHAISLFKRDDFPIDENALITAVGVIYNYLGLRSICEMYSIDYVETINNEVFLKFIPTQYFVALNNLMHGWLSEKDIDMSINVYINIITLLINKFKLE